MREATKKPAKNPTPVSKQQDTNTAPGFTVNHALDLANTSVDALKAYSEYKKETEVTKRALIEGEKDIRLGEQELDKERMKNIARLKELDNADQSGLLKHEETMEALRLQEKNLDSKIAHREFVQAQVDEGKITPEQAVSLLRILQE